MGSDNLDSTRFSRKEFLKIMSALDSQTPSVATKSYEVFSTFSILLQQKMRREYGNMLPRTGVYFTPDLKVIEILR